MPLRPYLLPILVFLLAGPFTGFLTAYALVPPRTWSGGDYLAMLALSYIFGTIPALVTAFLYVVLWPLVARLRLRLRLRSVRALGCLTGVAAIFPLLAWAASSAPRWGYVEYAMFALPAAVCGTLAARIRDNGAQD